MKLTIFGASGGVGKEAVSLALTNGHRVRAVYRDASTAPARTELEACVIPNLLDVSAVAGALEGADAVLCSVGLRRKSLKNPWSKLMSPHDFTSEFAKCLIRAIEKNGGPRRVVFVSAAGVGPGWAQMSVLLRLLFGWSSIGIAYRDLALMERILEESGLNLTCVQPTTLTDGPLTGKVRLTERFAAMDSISRADVAWFMLKCLEPSSAEARRTLMITH